MTLIPDNQGDPLEVREAYAMCSYKRERRFDRNCWVFWVACAAVLIATIGYARANNSAHCIAHGVPAICRSAHVEAKAQKKARSLCPRCAPQAISDAIYSLQMNRGPYASSVHLARDAVPLAR